MLIVNRKVFYGVNFVGHLPIEKFNVILIFRHQHEFFWTTQFDAEEPEGVGSYKIIDEKPLILKEKIEAKFSLINVMATLRSAA